MGGSRVPPGVRRFAERMSRYVYFRKRMPKRFGGDRIYVTPSAALAFWIKPVEKMDPALFDRIQEFVKPGDCFWDVGANVGTAAFAAAAVAGRTGTVVAFEPDLFLVYLLRKSAAQPRPDRAAVEIAPAAISDSVGLARFHLARRGRASNYLEGFGESQAGGSARVDWVPSFTLDSMLAHFRPPNVLKIDVEGAEEPVLNGAAALLSKHRPIIFCEVSQRSSARVSELLRGLGYVLYDMEAAPADRRELPIAGPNIVAICNR